MKLFPSVIVPILDGWPNVDSKIVFENDDDDPKDEITLLLIDWAFPILIESNKQDNILNIFLICFFIKI